MKGNLQKIDKILQKQKIFAMKMQSNYQRLKTFKGRHKYKEIIDCIFLCVYGKIKCQSLSKIREI